MFSQTQFVQKFSNHFYSATNRYFFFCETKPPNFHDTFGKKMYVIDKILALLQLFKVEPPLPHDRLFVGDGTSLPMT